MVNNKEKRDLKVNNTNKQKFDFNNLVNKSKEIIFLIGRFIKLFFANLLKRTSGINKPKVYKLRGYTTTSRVDKKVSSEYNQRLLRNILVGAIFAVILAMLLLIFNPLKDIRELFRIIGI